MGRPKALKDLTRKESLPSSKVKLHKKFDENETIEDEHVEFDSLSSSLHNSKTNVNEEDDDAPEVVSKEESLSMRKLMELHEQSIALKSNKKQKIQKNDKITEKSLDAIDLNILAEIGASKDKTTTDENNDGDESSLEDAEQVAEINTSYGIQTRKM